MQYVTLPPIRIGFEYSVEVHFPADYLHPSEGIRAELRARVEDEAPLAVFDASRNENVVTLYLAETVTATFEPLIECCTDMVLLLNPAGELALTDIRFVTQIEQHATRA